MTEEEIGEIHLDFVYHIDHLRSEHSLDLDLIVNMDETGCHFDMPSNTTVDVIGSKHISIRTTNNSQCCTVFLSCSVSGSKIEPLVVFKGTSNGTIEK